MAEEKLDEAVDTASDESPAPKKKKNKVKIVGIVVGVILVLGIGLFVWHEQPSFCNAICHTPMDAYGDTFLKGDVDKYGNELTEQQSMGMMAYAHKEKAGFTCMKCHVPVLGQQVSEAMNWVSGNYEIIGTNQKGQALLKEHTIAELSEPIGMSGDEFCLRSGCHVNDDGSDMTRADLAAKTAHYGNYNPHESHNGDMACDQCHKAHSQSVNFCSSCHAGEAPIPDGWVNYTTAQANAKKVEA